MNTRLQTAAAVMLTVLSLCCPATQAQSTNPADCPNGRCNLNTGSNGNSGSLFNPYHPPTTYGPSSGSQSNDDWNSRGNSTPLTFQPLRQTPDDVDNFRPVRYDDRGDMRYDSDTNRYPQDKSDRYQDRRYETRRDTGSDGWNSRGQVLHEQSQWDSRNRYLNQDSLADPFRLPSASEDYGTTRYDFISRNNQWRDRQYQDTTRDGYQSQYRIPLDRSNDFPALDQRDLNRDDFPVQDAPRPTTPTRGRDPFTPAPQPQQSGSPEVSEINARITARYQNPVTVRSVRSMSSSQAVQLFREVCQQTDQRHLEPSSYDLRVRRAIRNLGLALDNSTFSQSLGVSNDSFRTDAFRNSLSRIYESMRVSSLSDAERVLQQVMQEAQAVPGLGANVVAFEFANATIDTLDKFSALEPADPNRGAALENEQRTAGLESEIVGIGVEVKEHADGLVILKTLRGGPAADIGLKAGDLITAIDRRSIAGMSMATSVDLMKGTSGSSITLRIVRDGYEPRETTLVRRRVRVWTVNDMKILSGTDKVAYLNLSQFGQTSTQELDDALQKLHREGMKSLVLDLRGNPGGLLNVCVDITDRFLPCGTIVATKGRLSSDNMHETASFDRTWSTPLVVLVDGDSASASEIFAAAVQDNQRGLVVGDKSYGKGSVQTHFPLRTISGNLRLTTAKFYSPSGRAMSGTGVTPDVHVVDQDGPINGDQVLIEAVRVAESRQLKDMAAAAAKCRTNNSAAPLLRNSFNDNMFDTVQPPTVLR